MWLIGFSLDGLIAFDCGQVDRFVVLFGVSVVCLRFTVGFWGLWLDCFVWVI